MGSGQMCWLCVCNPSTQAGKAKDHKFKISLGDIVSSRPASTETLSQANFSPAKQKSQKTP